MAISSYVYPDNRDLMVTHSDDETKILHKVNTAEYYDDPIDLISGFIQDGPRKGQPYCRFEYEEVDRPEEPKEPEEEVNEDDGSEQDDNQTEA